jgi:hypothetical protein
MSITLLDGSTTDEEIVTRFVNSAGELQVVTEGPDATCPTCGYPERHRLIEIARELTMIADGCPSCETSRMSAADVEVGGQP